MCLSVVCSNDKVPGVLAALLSAFYTAPIAQEAQETAARATAALLKVGSDITK